MVYLSPLRSPPIGTARFNPHHDKGGKFASGGGGGAWKPGAWQGVSAEDYRRQVAGEQTALADENDKRFGVTAPAGYNRRLGEDIAAQQVPDGTVVHVNGPYRVVNQGGKTDPNVMHAAETQLDSIVESNPLPNGMTVTFAGRKLDGASALGSPEGVLVSSEVGLVKSKNAFILMPEAEHHANIEYTLTHEYGHVLMYQKGHGPEAMTMVSENKSALSLYGGTDYKEAYAESFAEFHLSAGLTENSAALKYAEVFGWQAPQL